MTGKRKFISFLVAILLVTVSHYLAEGDIGEHYSKVVGVIIWAFVVGNGAEHAAGIFKK